MGQQRQLRMSENWGKTGEKLETGEYYPKITQLLLKRD